MSGIIPREQADIEIGAVEIKDKDSTTRANVGANGLEVDVKAIPLPSDAATESTLTSIASSVATESTLTSIASSVATESTLSTLSSKVVYADTSNIAGTVVATATDLDIRDLTSVSDSVEAKQSTHANLKGTMIITDGTYTAEVDSLGYLAAIEIEHHKVHDGVFYIISDIDTSVDTAAPKYWHIITPDSSARFHVKINIETDTGGLLEFFENPTTTNNGTGLTSYNADRNSGNSTTVSFYKDPTISSDGTRIQVARIGAGRDKKLGGTARSQAEYILKQNEQYLVKITPDSNGAEVTINIEGYEI